MSTPPTPTLPIATAPIVASLKPQIWPDKTNPVLIAITTTILVALAVIVIVHCMHEKLAFEDIVGSLEQENEFKDSYNSRNPSHTRPQAVSPKQLIAGPAYVPSTRSESPASSKAVRLTNSGLSSHATVTYQSTLPEKKLNRMDKPEQTLHEAYHFSGSTEINRDSSYTLQGFLQSPEIAHRPIRDSWAESIDDTASRISSGISGMYGVDGGFEAMSNAGYGHFGSSSERYVDLFGRYPPSHYNDGTVYTFISEMS
ncbi:hypothetical protein CC78DRAFT_538701 [Lojkania enalia]|uniref:Uncharacterized protein n=1 Tax=Lojkania enalia TaxID=147567 RepID=A0A9P4ND45_9PLEO|nr:hypothetical protein CC78DRAFT_538701 [Didymosphaeria enalia]